LFHISIWESLEVCLEAKLTKASPWKRDCMWRKNWTVSAEYYLIAQR